MVKNLKNKKVTVMGLGLHGGGVACVLWLAKHGAKVTVTDLKTKEELRSSLDKLKISEKRKLSLLKKHPIDEIDKAVGRVLKWTSRKNDEAAILTALREKDTWNDQVSIEDQIKENSKYLEQYRRLDNTKIGEYKVSVSYKYISFSYGRFYKEFSVVDKNFLEDLENFLHKISTHFTLSEWTKEI